MKGVNILIQSFANQESRDIYDGNNTKKARKLCPRTLWRNAQKKLTLLNTAKRLADLRCPPGNRLEALSQEREGQWSIRINDQYRICFYWFDSGPTEVEIVDYHS